MSPTPSHPAQQVSSPRRPPRSVPLPLLPPGCTRAGGCFPGLGVRSSLPPHPHPHPAPCCVFEFVPFHLISCFSPFSHCPLGVAEVGVSDVPVLLPRPLLLPQSPPVPVLCQPIILY